MLRKPPSLCREVRLSLSHEDLARRKPSASHLIASRPHLRLARGSTDSCPPLLMRGDPGRDGVGTDWVGFGCDCATGPLLRRHSGSFGMMVLSGSPSNRLPWMYLEPSIPLSSLFAAAREPACPRTSLREYSSQMSRASESLCLFGMTRDIAELISALSLTKIELLARQLHRHLKPRWEDQPTVWRHLLVAAQTEDMRPQRALCLRSLRLLAGNTLYAQKSISADPRHQRRTFENC